MMIGEEAGSFLGSFKLKTHRVGFYRYGGNGRYLYVCCIVVAAYNLLTNLAIAPVLALVQVVA